MGMIKLFKEIQKLSKENDKLKKRNRKLHREKRKMAELIDKATDIVCPNDCESCIWKKHCSGYFNPVRSYKKEK